MLTTMMTVFLSLPVSHVRPLRQFGRLGLNQVRLAGDPARRRSRIADTLIDSEDASSTSNDPEDEGKC